MTAIGGSLTLVTVNVTFSTAVSPSMSVILNVTFHLGTRYRDGSGLIFNVISNLNIYSSIVTSNCFVLFWFDFKANVFCSHQKTLLSGRLLKVGCPVETEAVICAQPQPACGVTGDDDCVQLEPLVWWRPRAHQCKTVPGGPSLCNHRFVHPNLFNKMEKIFVWSMINIEK